MTSRISHISRGSLRIRRSAWAIMLVLVASTSFAGESAERLQVADYLDWERVSDPQVSPDGNRIIYTRSWVNAQTDTWSSDLWIVAADGSRNRRLTRGSSPLWSPDGSRIAYLAEGEPDGTQIFVRWMDGEGSQSEATQITRVEHSPTGMKWSPDGKSLAFAMRVEGTDAWKIDVPSPPEGAKWTKPPRVVRDMHYRQDRRGFMESGFLHLFVVPADGGTPRQLTEGNWHVGARPAGLAGGVGLDWTPDGEALIFDGNQDDDADESFGISHIYRVDVASREITQLTETDGAWTSPVVAPDGAFIAYTGSEYSDQTYQANDLYVMTTDGKDPRVITEELDRSPRNLHWSDDNRGIYFTIGDRGSSNVYFASATGGVQQVTQGVHMLSLASVSDGGLAAATRTSPKAPGDVVCFRLDAPSELRQITSVNDDILAYRQLGDVEEVWYPSADGTRIQGWIVKPPEFDDSKQYPLILHIHGGPHGMYSVAFNFSFQHLAADDYVVLYTNPRGSTGYGTEFGNAIDNAYPSVDYDDLMAGVDAMLDRGYIDDARMYVTGVSGGGVLSSWIIGHTDRFAAAAVRAPVINWISFAGTTDITSWGFMRFRPPYWEDPDLWLRHSPIMYVKNVTTPTMLMTGELDLRTPMAQSEEYYQALRQLDVETVLVRFHGEYHGTGSKPSNFMRTQQYLLSWFDQHAKDAQPDKTTDAAVE